MLRIITGTAKGKKLKTLEGVDTRPTSERIKEALFSAIQFDIDDRRVLDLFAGSGQLALEALSRGAASAMLVDSEREAMEVAKENARTTGFFQSARYLVSDWRNYIRKASGRDKFDLVFIDPPYAMECCRDAVERLVSAGMLANGAIVVCESGTEELDFSEREDIEVIKSTHYGKKTFLNILLYRAREGVE